MGPVATHETNSIRLYATDETARNVRSPRNRR